MRTNDDGYELVTRGISLTTIGGVNDHNRASGVNKLRPKHARAR